MYVIRLKIKSKWKTTKDYRLFINHFEPYLMICTCCQNAIYIILQNCIIPIRFTSFYMQAPQNHSDNTNQYHLRFVIEAKNRNVSLLLSMQINTFSHIWSCAFCVCIFETKSKYVPCGNYSSKWEIAATSIWNPCWN